MPPWKERQGSAGTHRPTRSRKASVRMQERKALHYLHSPTPLLPPPDGLDVQMTTMLYKNLSSLAPEIKECVDACNFISRSRKEQNSDGAVSQWDQLQKSCPPAPPR